LLFNKTNEPGISSPSPDVAMVCLQLAMFSLALAACNRSPAKARNRRTIQVAAVLLLSGLAVTFKLSSIAFSLGNALLASRATELGMLPYRLHPISDQICGCEATVSVSVFAFSLARTN
jgi:hypothetical protein